MSKSDLERDMALQMKAHKIPTPECEYRFHDTRKWRFDMAWPAVKLAVEVDGGTWIPGGGRHNRPQGFANDAHKFNAAALDGWTVLRFTKDMIENGIAIETLKRAFRILDERPIHLWPTEKAE